ncbi:MAG: extracellular solute-binding protein [Anaerolineaceae bacterium]|nr:MAG: extracellular solute-binding protein [Anaerolineaceae bacterium]
MTKRAIRILFLTLFISSLVLTACQPAATEEPTTEPTKAPPPTEVPPTEAPPPTEPPPPPEPTGPYGVTAEDLQGVEVEFWHVWSRSVGEAIEALAAEFTATNEYGITVTAINQGGYSDMFNNMNAAINTGDLPDLVVGYNNQYLSWDAAGDVIEDLTPYVENESFGYTAEEVADFYPAFWASDTIGDERLGIPAQRSGQYYFYNYTWAQELGFDSPPTTPAEFKEQACASAAANDADDDPANDGTGGVFFKAEASTIVGWIWGFGGEVEVPGVGYDFDTPEALETWTFWHELLSEGCAWTPEAAYPNPEFAARLGLFFGSSIAGVPYQESDMADAGNDDVWGPIPFPTVTGEPVVDLYGPSFAMVISTPEEQLATWLFMKWFTEPENQAKWIEASAYYPTRASVLDLLGDYMESNAKWADSLANLVYGKVEPRFESWSSVRYTLADAFALLNQEGFTVDQIPQILADLQAEADELHAETME